MPRTNDLTATREKRMKAIYTEDEGKTLRKSHENPAIIDFYKEWGKPGCHKSHEYLHTHYVPRGEYNELTLSTLLDKFFMIRAANFLLFFIGLELASEPKAVLHAFDK